MAVRLGVPSLSTLSAIWDGSLVAGREQSLDCCSCARVRRVPTAVKSSVASTLGLGRVADCSLVAPLVFRRGTRFSPVAVEFGLSTACIRRDDRVACQRVAGRFLLSSHSTVCSCRFTPGAGHTRLRFGLRELPCCLPRSIRSCFDTTHSDPCRLVPATVGSLRDGSRHPACRTVSRASRRQYG